MIEDRGGGPRVAWFDETQPTTAGEALRPRQEIAEDEIGESKERAQWLGELLMDRPKPSIDVFKASIDAGYTRDQVKRAPNTASEPSPVDKVSRKAAQWTWELLTDASG